MKLYLYGYRHGIRSSRKLQRETKTNIQAVCDKKTNSWWDTTQDR
ncbi:MAG: hypothetical protein U5Q03_07895 [Bacteroidota bacterium]|nr:hypothetical protein [Bacteroidota bacterium]